MQYSSSRSMAPTRLNSAQRPTGAQILRGIVLCEGAGVFGWLFTLASLREWYPTLIKPIWTPPNWIFAPVWTLLYALMGIALAYFWASNAPTARKRVVFSWFWTQLGLNVLWSLAFFGLRSPGWGYAIIMVLWCAIAALLWTGSRLSRVAFWLLVPYFLWVTFASSLNFAILSFNVLKQNSAEMDADPRNQNSPADPPIIDRKK